MLNLGPTNCEGNGDSPDVIVESASEDDDIDISQFVESVLEEPEEPAPSRSSSPMVVFPNQNARKSMPGFRGTPQLPVLAPIMPHSSQQVIRIGPGIRQVQTVPYTVPALRHVFPGKSVLVNNQGNITVASNELPSIAWLKECFEKVKTSCATLNYEVKNLEERLKFISSTSDTKKIASLSNDLQSLLKQTELGYKYLGTNLSSDHQKWALKTSQRRITKNMTSNGSQSLMIKRQILLPLTGEANATIALRGTDRLTLPPNMLISINGSNHSLSITTMEKKKLDEKHIAELCAKFNIKPCYVLLERCDEDKDTDNDDIEIIEELIAL